METDVSVDQTGPWTLDHSPVSIMVGKSSSATWFSHSWPTSSPKITGVEYVGTLKRVKVYNIMVYSGTHLGYFSKGTQIFH